MSETQNPTQGQAIIASDIAQRKQAKAQISEADIAERQRNPQHKDILTELAIAQWMQQNPGPDANRDTLELVREDVEWTKRLLERFEANGYRYPKRADQP